jgi:hypothetical protein
MKIKLRVKITGRVKALIASMLSPVMLEKAVSKNGDKGPGRRVAAVIWFNGHALEECGHIGGY